MPQILLGIAVLVAVLWGLQKLQKANPKHLAAGLKGAGGVIALAGAALLSVRGQFGLAVPLGMAGLALLGWMPGTPAGFGKRWNRTPGQVSRVRTAVIEMELDHDTGAMRGRLLSGAHAGVELDALPVPALLQMLGEIDEESRALLAAYLDRREPAWREHADDGATTGQGAAAGGPMTQEEAYQVLGLQPGASADEIRRAHRTLMKKLHPDQGGSTYLAARVNQAKDILLRRHR